MQALQDHLVANGTNAIAQSHVIEAVMVSLDAYEDELYRQGETNTACWAVMLGMQPMIVLHSKRNARSELRRLKRAAGGEGAWRLARTQVASA